MRSFLVRCCLTAWLSPLLVSGVATAETPAEQDDLEKRLEALEGQVRALQAEVAGLRAVLTAEDHAAQPAARSSVPAQAAAPTAAPAPSSVLGNEPAGQLPGYGGAQAGAKVFNPDIGVIGNFISASGDSAGGSDALAPVPFATLQESEASLQAIVDPFARADFFLAIGEEGIEVEEGYVTFPTLPGGLLVKAGRMRANFGRLNAFHNHTLPWVDRPLVMYNLLGGSSDDPDTGIKDAGVSVSRLIPAGKLFVEATGELYRGDSGTLFTSSRREDFTVVGRLRSYVDLTDQSGLEGGFSYARGHNDVGSDFVTELYGADATLRWRPLSRAIYRSLAARTEMIWSRREELSGTQAAFGFYVPWITSSRVAGLPASATMTRSAGVRRRSAIAASPGS